MENNGWLYNDKPFDETLKDNYFGFVYLIVEVDTQRMYIGRKSFWMKRRTKKSKRRVTSESNWKNYYGSNNLLIEQIKVKGKDNYKRYILRLCKTQGECIWYELEEQVKRDVLKSDTYYNDNIAGKYYKHIVRGY